MSETPIIEALLWDTRTTAAALSISERTLFGLTVPRGMLKCVRLPGRTMYRPSDVSAWIDDQQLNPLPPKTRETPIVRKPKRGGCRTPKKRAEVD